MKKNEIILRFCVYDFEDISHSDVTDIVGREPSRVKKIGDKKNPLNPNSSLVKNNSWMMEADGTPYSSFEDQMEFLLDILEPRIEMLKPFSKKYHCEFSCALYIYFDNGESTPWVHLDSRYNKIIRELNIEFDVDLYVLPGKSLTS
jgi:Domain of unknown function (DUF4279)